MQKIGRHASGASLKPFPPGPHPARLTVIAELGLREGQWGEKFEIGLGVEVFIRDADNWSPHLVPDVVTLSLHDKSDLYQYVVAILGGCPDEIDPATLLGGEFMVTLNSRPSRMKGYFPAIDKVLALPASATLPESQAPSLVFDLDAPDPQVFEGLPRLFQKIIQDNRIRHHSADTTPVGEATSVAGRLSQNPFAAPSEEGGYFASKNTSEMALGRGTFPESDAQQRVPNPFTDADDGNLWAEIAEAFPKPRQNPFEF